MTHSGWRDHGDSRAGDPAHILTRGSRVGTNRDRGAAGHPRGSGLAQVRRGGAEVGTEVADGGGDDLGGDGFPAECLVGSKAVAAPEGVEIITALTAFDPEHVDGGHPLRIFLRKERDIQEQHTPAFPTCPGTPRPDCAKAWVRSASPAVPLEWVQEELPLHPEGYAHLQGLHQALHLSRIQLCRDGPDEDAHGHIVHGRDVLCMDAPVFVLSHGCGGRPAFAVFCLAQPSPLLCPEQCSAQPGPSASSLPCHRHRHSRRPTVLQSHSEGAGQTSGPGARAGWPAACSGEPAVRAALGSSFPWDTHGHAAAEPPPCVQGSLSCPLEVWGPTWPCWALRIIWQLRAGICPPPAWLYQEHVHSPEPPPSCADTYGVHGKEDEA
ncbi:hypothetical protein Nmel_015029 [Mimus melanotis]